MRNETSIASRRKVRLGINLRALIAATSLCIGAADSARAQVTQTVLHVFGVGDDGAEPTGSLIADNTGPSETLRGLYGTTFDGGKGACTGGGCGTVFKMTPPKAGHTDWGESAIWKFTGNVDGAEPLAAGLLATTKRISAKTTLYGTTNTGGASNAGTVFGLTGKKLTTVWAFTGGSDGADPGYGEVVADKSGALYVSANFGGGQSDCGTVIKLAPPVQGQTAWTETTIWTFSGGKDGCSPHGLTIDAAGEIYGLNYEIGKGYGAVFKLIPPQQQQMPWTEQTLWTFKGGTDGSYPSAPLIAGEKGVFYGTTLQGGTSGDGVVFSLTPPKDGKAMWKEQVLWSFTGGSDGFEPGQVILDKSGAIYGTTSGGAINNNGSVFMLKPPAHGNAWTETTLWDFSGTDGAIPLAGLTADTNGTLYGTTATGGSGTNCSDSGAGCGVAFSLSGTGFVPK